MKIYVASSWRNAYQPEIVTALLKAGHEVYDFRNPPDGNKGFHWSDIDDEWKAWTPDAYRRGLAHRIAQYGAGQDIDGMRWADMCVLVLPCGRSAHLEAGWFMGFGKPCVVYVPEAIEPELMYLLAGEFPNDWMAVDFGELLVCVERAGRAIASRPNDDRKVIGLAVGLAVENDGLSVSLLQRRLQLGYSRASYIVDYLVHKKILGGFKTPHTCVRKCLLDVAEAVKEATR